MDAEYETIEIYFFEEERCVIVVVDAVIDGVW